ncbi:MBOAT family protein [Aureispira]|nr:MBOAT family protein [Aureispira sp.]
MLFNSFLFILAFLPIVWVVYFSLTRLKKIIIAKSWLFISSLFFYAWWNPIYLPLILCSMIVNFHLGSQMSKLSEKKVKKRYLILGLIFNVSLLSFFKYTNFFIDNINIFFDDQLPTYNIILPLAISFFTFQQIAYLSDSYKGLTKEYNFFHYGLFVSFFPQLIAGPIVHHKEMMPQFSLSQNTKFNYENTVKGLYMFFMGLCKKVLIADNFAVIANKGYSNIDTLSTMDAWLTSSSYTFQLYYDFSGYSDMAIGAALLFNIKIAQNFNSPYKALDIQDFWRRWHMTLSRFLRDYIYIPLGGNRNGEFNTLRNLMLTFLIGGLWHGAGWTFIMWGFLHGFALILHRTWKKSGLSLPNVLSWIITFLFVHIAWVFFRAITFEDAWNMLGAMFSLNGTQINVFTNIFSLPIIILGVIILFTKNTNIRLNRFKPTYLNLIFLIFLIVLGFIQLNSDTSSEFLYFDF